MIIKQLIQGALRKLGVYPPGESPTAAEISDALESVNRMLYSWSVDSNAVYESAYETFSLVSGTQDYTYGAGGDFDSARPIEILSCAYRDNGIDFTLPETTRQNWMDIGQKSLESIPQFFLHEPEYPLAKISFWPVPDDNYTIVFYAKKPLNQYSSSAENVGLPPEYEEAIEWNLAVRLAPEYLGEVPQTVLMMANSAFAQLKQYHAQPIPQIMTAYENQGMYNINEDE